MPVISLVLSLPASGDVLIHLLLETTCSVLKYLIPKDSSNAYGGTGNWPYSEPKLVKMSACFSADATYSTLMFRVLNR